MRERTLPAILFASMAMLLVLAGCLPSQQEPVPDAMVQPELHDSSWQLEAYGTPGTLKDAIPGKEPTIDFATSDLSGSAGCNSYFGTYTYDTDGTLAIDQLSNTEMACMEAGVMQQEQVFLDTLREAESYRVVQGKLRIVGGGNLLVLGRAAEAQNPAEVPATEEEEDEPEPVEQPPLKNTSWTLEAFGEPGNMKAAIAGKEPTLHFTTGDINGSGGCNSFFGTYTSDTDGTLEIEGLGSTMMLCTNNDIMNQEHAFLDALGDAETYEVVGGDLLIEGGGKVLILVETEEEPAPVEQPPLKNTSWELEAYGTPGNLTAAISGKEPTLHFTTGDVNGSGGCNSFFGTYTSDTEGTLEIDGLGSTMMLCTNVDVRNQEQAFLDALGDAETYEVIGGDLRIAGGGKVLLFVEREEQPQLKNTSWELEAYGTPGHLTAAVPGKESTLSFTTSNVSGVAGCNSFSGTYTSDVDGTLEVTDLGSTMMLCIDVNVRNQETAFLEALRNAETYEVVGGDLLIEGDGKLLILTAA
ncbi:MAG: META domain-containing protein [Dehalococcoidia bacterium]|nr:META domain-containing protein [Dehalococcoidia bacterium]